MLQRKAFTLVELLVVISIIVLLISMLVPATEKALGLGQAASCAANQHSIKTALAYYLGDFQRTYTYGLKGPPSTAYYPDPPHGPGTPTGHFQDGAKPPQQLLFTYVGGAHKVFVCPTDTNPIGYQWWWFYDAPDFRVPEGSRPGEVRTPGGVGTPVDNTGLGVNDPTGGTLAANEKVPSYTVNGSSYMFSEDAILGAASWDKSALRAGEIISPSKFGYMTDGNWCPNGWNWWTVDKPSGFGWRIEWSHPNKTVNMLFGDGSIGRTEMQGIGGEIRSNPLKDFEPPQ